MSDYVKHTLLALLAFLCWSILLVLLGILFSRTAYARPMTSTECAGLSKSAEQIATYRDKKADIVIVKQAYVDAGRKNRALPASYVQTDEDEAMLPALVDFVYANPSASPAQLGLLVFKACYLAGQKVNVRES